MRVTLEKSIKDNKLPALTNAANAALLKLNQYYSKALDCQFNIVATCEFAIIYFNSESCVNGEISMSSRSAP